MNKPHSRCFVMKPDFISVDTWTQSQW